ncbi:MAG: hypothetical protein JOZ62_23070, partial [Acidobacteriaceae bacterium]|nr:hypothetical protein [Acidobacteriaceae bacterium]
MRDIDSGCRAAFGRDFGLAQRRAVFGEALKTKIGFEHGVGTEDVRDRYIRGTSLGCIVVRQPSPRGVAGGNRCALLVYASNFAGAMNFASDSKNPQDTGYPYSNALFGILTSYTETTTRPPMYEFNTGLDWYAQDTWKISRSLTLDYGLRFGWSTPWHSNHNQEAGFLPWLWDPQQRVQLIQPVLANGKRMGFDPVTRQIVAITDIGAVAPEAGNPYNGIVNRLTNPGYPRGLRYTDGIKTMPRLSFA